MTQRTFVSPDATEMELIQERPRCGDEDTSTCAACRARKTKHQPYTRDVHVVSYYFVTKSRTAHQILTKVGGVSARPHCTLSVRAACLPSHLWVPTTGNQRPETQRSTSAKKKGAGLQTPHVRGLFLHVWHARRWTYDVSCRKFTGSFQRCEARPLDRHHLRSAPRVNEVFPLSWTISQRSATKNLADSKVTSRVSRCHLLASRRIHANSSRPARCWSHNQCRKPPYFSSSAIDQASPPNTKSRAQKRRSPSTTQCVTRKPSQPVNHEDKACFTSREDTTTARPSC